MSVMMFVQSSDPALLLILFFSIIIYVIADHYRIIYATADIKMKQQGEMPRFLEH